jgi:LacI family repressor for deo operon, udp, cdd, tsx, nupC, and nupG
MVLWKKGYAMKDDVTYEEIARETGVSAATVSRILTGSAPVSGATSQKVFDFLEKNNYDMGMMRSRKTAHSGGLIIFNVPSMGNPFYGPICNGAKTAALNYGYNLLINEEHINNNTLANFINLIKRTRAAGLIITNSAPGALLRKIAAVIPLVQCCEYDETIPLPYVSINDITASRNAMEYLFSLGRKNIAFINGPIRYKYARQRLQGYLEALKNAGIPSDPKMIIQLSEINYDLAFSALSGFFDSGGRPDAFFCASDVLATAAIKAGTQRGFSVPGDLAVVGFDNVEISSMTNPTITTVAQPMFQLGFSGCELLIEHITNPHIPVHNIILATELLVRESTTIKPA